MISFVVPAHNEEELIGRTIAAVHEAAEGQGEPYEVVVVNDSSTDRTARIAGEQRARVIDVHHRQIAATRNTGAQAANGDILIFVDGDTMVTRGAVRAAVRALRHGAVGGGCCIRFERPVPLYAAVLEGLLRVGLFATGLAPGCFLFCTRAAYLRGGGFDETMYCAEEVAFARRLKQLGRFVIVRQYVVTSPRKLRTRSALDLIALFLRFALAGPKSFRQREGLEYWYGPR